MVVGCDVEFDLLESHIQRSVAQISCRLKSLQLTVILSDSSDQTNISQKSNQCLWTAALFAMFRSSRRQSIDQSRIATLATRLSLFPFRIFTFRGNNAKSWPYGTTWKNSRRANVLLPSVQSVKRSRRDVSQNSVVFSGLWSSVNTKLARLCIKQKSSSSGRSLSNKSLP